MFECISSKSEVEGYLTSPRFEGRGSFACFTFNKSKVMDRCMGH
jgi:hypothetical protein